MLYKIKRYMVKSKLDLDKRNEINILNKLNSEQIKIYNLILKIASKHADCIKFNPESDEILFFLPDMLIEMKDFTIKINGEGFLQMNLPMSSYNLLLKKIYRYSNKDRRKLLFASKQKLNLFINKLTTYYD